MAKLTDKQKRFVDEYLIDLNASAACVRAGYKTKNSDQVGFELLGKTLVSEAIQEAIKEREQRTEITADRVVQELWNIVTADANSIVELRRCCCRYCWGTNNKYQLTPNEMRARENSYAVEKEQSEKEGKQIAPFDLLGGAGYNSTKDPNVNCPECFGEGTESPFFKDTRKMTAGAKSLYAGVKVTKDGLEVKMHSKDKAIELLGKHLGMFIEKIEVKDTTDRAQIMKKARERVRNGQASREPDNA